MSVRPNDRLQRPGLGWKRTSLSQRQSAPERGGVHAQVLARHMGQPDDSISPLLVIASWLAARARSLAPAPGRLPDVRVLSTDMPQANSRAPRMARRAGWRRHAPWHAPCP